MAKPLSLRALGAEIRALREARGLSQEELAANASLHRNFIGLIERGQRNPTFMTLIAISGALGVSLSAVISAAESAGRPSRP